jgi:hypothetical protein
MKRRSKRPDPPIDDDAELAITRPDIFAEELGPSKPERLTDQELILKFLDGELRSARNQEHAKETLSCLLDECAREFKALPMYVAFALSRLFDARYVTLTIEHHQEEVDREIAMYIAREMAAGAKYEHLVETTNMRKLFGVSRSKAARAWAKYKAKAKAAVREEAEWQAKLASEC